MRYGPRLHSPSQAQAARSTWVPDTTHATIACRVGREQKKAPLVQLVRYGQLSVGFVATPVPSSRRRGPRRPCSPQNASKKCSSYFQVCRSGPSNGSFWPGLPDVSASALTLCSPISIRMLNTDASLDFRRSSSSESDRETHYRHRDWQTP